MARRIALLGLAAVLLAGAGVGVALDRQDDETAGTAAVEATTTTLGVTTTSATTTTSTSPSTTTTVGPTTSTTSRRTTTTVRRTTTTSRATTTTTGPVAAGSCTPAQVVVTIATDRLSYTAAQPVEVTTTLHNRSTASCTYNGYTAGIVFADASGRQFGGANVIADSFRDVPFEPDAMLIHKGPWDHMGAVPGTYTATATWRFAGGTYTATASFTLS